MQDLLVQPPLRLRDVPDRRRRVSAKHFVRTEIHLSNSKGLT